VGKTTKGDLSRDFPGVTSKRAPACAILLALLLCACAAPQTRQLVDAPPATLPVATLIKRVPFFPQQAYYCGPATLAMTMNFHGLNVSQEALARAVYVPELKGSLQAEMLAATRQRGLLAYVLTPDLQSLLEEIAAGHPVVVLQNLGVSWYPVWHYAVAIGYDLDAREIVLHSGAEPNYRVPLSTFERTWARSDHWALVPLPPEELPHDHDPLRVVEAAAALEQTGQPAAAQKAFTAAVRRWPDQFLARMGLGNTRYALGDVKGAMRAFVAATHIEPAAAAAWNNLAVTLHELGCQTAARAAARSALRLAGAEPSYRETLRQIETAPAARNASRTCTASTEMTKG
jgi:tetratricopeptide (TPR) repeat protein